MRLMPLSGGCRKRRPAASEFRRTLISGNTFSWPITGRGLYAPIGNPGPDFLAAARPGDNLYTDSVVALDALTGKLAWYVQQIPGDYHDWDTAAAPVLYEQEGHRYLAVGGKGGYVYIYDRDSHTLLAKTPVSTIQNVETPLSRDRSVRVRPGTVGGVDWNGPAYSPESKLLFVGTVDW
jgi:alcohol dehydrogenase (cytochrome c)